MDGLEIEIINLPKDKDTVDIMKQAEKAFHEIFDNMPDGKKQIIDQMSGAYGCWQCAREAYLHVSEKNPKQSDGSRLLEIGMWADMSLAALARVMKLLNKGLEDTLTTMDETSRWLQSKGWHCLLPCPTDENGATVQKTAHGMYNDMVRFSKARQDYMKALDAQQEAFERDSRRKRD